MRPTGNSCVSEPSVRLLITLIKHYGLESFYVKTVANETESFNRSSLFFVMNIVIQQLEIFNNIYCNIYCKY